MATFAREKGIDYPIAIDVGDKTKTAFAVDSYPDYYLIDRAGKLRVADLSNGELERVVKVLLGEGAPAPSALATASATAVKKDKRILVLWGSEAERKAVDGMIKAGKLATLMRNEYEVVRLERGANPELADALQAGSSGASLCALDSKGALLARLDAPIADAGTLEKFLQANRIPVQDAEVIWSDALARAQREKKNLLVHLGAPW